VIAWNEYPTGNHRLSCPACGRKPADKTLGVTVDHDGRAVAHCFRCEYVETYRPEHGTRHRPSTAPVRSAAVAKHETLSDYGRELWDACRPAHGAALAYLKARHCVVPPQDGAMRCHPALKHPSGYAGPALVALVTDTLTRQPISLHRTWINADGTKADVDPPRLLLGGHRKQGGAIRLWPDECVTYGLGIAEGIETALTLARVRAPVWSLIDAGNLAAFPVLPAIEVLTIAADHDDAGIRAATDCAEHWASAGRDVRMVVPPKRKSDLNDMAREAA
jgi:putative DNA primase/helicase